MVGTEWASDAVLYQIYPQSFADGDGDGTGDFAGLTERLEYLQWLGVDAVWLNPCFASPFGDAGYDVADFLTTAPRYGTPEDLAKFTDAARRVGIRVLLDLVAGHTSDRHPWFVRSAADPDDHRYVWADRPAPGYVASPGSRPGWYRPNFFDFQPALNFGYARTDPAEPWRQPVDAEGPRANRAALREIMAHWFGLGVSGFRVDMASSLVKDDPGFTETGRLWRETRAWMDAHHPDRVVLAEWGDPARSVPMGFHGDFFLQFGDPTEGGALRSLWNNGAGTVHEEWPDEPCYFDAEGRGSMRPFLAEWERAATAAAGHGFASLPTANHDFSRLACGPRTREQLAAAFAFQLTWPTVPAIYYGDEIGMRFVPGLPDTEGSVLGPRYNRAGSRTPMQWDATVDAGFSSAPTESFYLPLDPSPDRPDVASQRADESSLLHQVRELIALRRAHPGLGPHAPVEVLHSGYPLAYLRGERYLVVVNPRRTPACLPVERELPGRLLHGRGVSLTHSVLRAEGFSYAVFIR
ncbi:alpha-amylase family glycosyl hydrolase [Kitasatospora phosalacinea]|uniref:alpha-amylase family glycosyl hydrolase n=1 Tax=Kitasatospora phosalacinea TaxID=2065 RepID=UPI0005266640|nr:alpha-amylase family glycosyl hydrolase [Kitasatospora phosalacinea]